MRIIIATLGSHGDLHPFIGIGLELKRRGHDVVILAPAMYADLHAQVDLKFIPIGTEEEFESLAADRDIFHPRRGFKIVFGGATRLLQPYYDAILANYIPGDTILVYSTLVMSARVAQETHHIPAVSVHLSPAIFRSVYETPKIPPMPFADWQPHWLKRSMYAFADRFVIDRLLGRPLNQFRAQFNLPPVRSILGQWIHSPDRVIGLFPEWFAPQQPDWPSRTVLTDFPRFDERGVTAMLEKLIRFLNDGPPPVAFTPGSAMRHGQSVFACAIEACRRLKQRGILVTRHLEDVPANLPPNMLHVDYAPFSELLPRCAALLHHCGIGTTAQVLAAGIPHIAMPMAHDQADNADRLRRLGVAHVVPARKLTANTATAAIGDVLSNEAIRERARGQPKI